jgi:hypothetical protein
MAAIVRIAMWSGPRALSTALMRAWENRPDCATVDEPLYGAYLAETGLDHPMRDEIVASMDCDVTRVGRALSAMTEAPIIYQKHMSHHLLPSMPREWIDSLHNAFLIREPSLVLASYDVKRTAPTLSDIGIVQQQELFDRLCEQNGKPPPVLDAEDLQRKPAAALRALCAAVGVAFSSRMLRWPAGPRPSDGIWAAHWYNAVWQSTGFARSEARHVEFPPSLETICEQALPIYERMAAHRLPVDG